MHGYPVMQVVQYSVPTCTWGPPPPDLLRPPPVSVGEHFIKILMKFEVFYFISI